MATSLIYINLIPAAEQIAFDAKVREVAAKLKTNPDWLMQVMKAESGLRADIRNTYAPFADGYATGLIQFIPSTARALGTTTWDLEKLTRIQQMDYVYKYLQPYTGKLNSYFDVYLVIFFPAAIGHTNDDSYVFETKSISRASVAKSNPAINKNKDGMITMKEFKEYVKGTVPKSLWSRVFPPAGLAIVGILLAIGTTIFFLTRNTHSS
jgi:hypothetical protein